MFLSFGVGTGFATILIAHIMFNVSFVVVTVRSRLIGFDRSLEEAAQDLGANSFQTFVRVTLPLIMPGVLAAGLLAFALSIDDFVITNFNAGSTVTFPLYVWGAARVGVPPQINVIAAMIFVVTLVAMILTVWQQRRAERLAAMRPEPAAAWGPLACPPSGDLRAAGPAPARDRLIRPRGPRAQRLERLHPPFHADQAPGRGGGGGRRGRDLPGPRPRGLAGRGPHAPAGRLAHDRLVRPAPRRA